MEPEKAFFFKLKNISLYLILQDITSSRENFVVMVKGYFVILESVHLTCLYFALLSTR